MDRDVPGQVAVGNVLQVHEGFQNLNRRDGDDRDDMSFNFRPVKSILPIHSGQSLCVLSSILETKFSYPEKITIMMSDPVSVRSTRVSTPRITSDSVALKECSTKCANSCSALMRRTASVKTRPT